MTQTIATALGNVTVTDISMFRKIANGQYTMQIEIIFKNKTDTILKHSTDSELFGTLLELDYNDDRVEYSMKNKKFILEAAIENYVNSL